MQIKIADTQLPILEILRTDRSRLWWGAVCLEPLSKRKKDGLTQSKPGKFVEWEDMTIIGLGDDWRLIRDKHQTLKSWLSLEEAFIQKVCLDWHLPGLALLTEKVETASAVQEPSRKQLKLKLNDRPPWDVSAVSPLTWEASCNRSQFFVDCQPLQQVLCGHIPYS